METCLTVAWTWFGIAGSEDDYRVMRPYLEDGLGDQLWNYNAIGGPGEASDLERW